MAQPSYISYTTDGYNDYSHDYALSGSPLRMLVTSVTKLGSSSSAISYSGSVLYSACVEYMSNTTFNFYSRLGYYAVPGADSGTKTISVPADSYYVMTTLEFSGATGVVNGVGASAATTVSLDNLGANSVIVSAIRGHGIGGYTLDGSGSIIYTAVHDNADNRIDSSWAVSLHDPIGASSFLVDYNNQGGLAAFEIQGLGAGGTQILMFYNSFKKLLEDIRFGILPGPVLRERCYAILKLLKPQKPKLVSVTVTKGK